MKPPKMVSFCTVYALIMIFNDIFPPFLYFNSTEIDVMGELLVISDLLVKEMRKTDNHRLSVQEIYNLELTKLQSEKAANIRANLGHTNRFQDLLREKIDKNSRFAALNQVYELYLSKNALVVAHTTSII